MKGLSYIFALVILFSLALGASPHEHTYPVDISVLDVSLPSDMNIKDIQVGEKYTLYAHIHIKLDPDAYIYKESYTVSMYDGKLLSKVSYTIPNQTEYEAYIPFIWTPTSQGKHIIVAMVDEDNVISETNEDNNLGFIFLNVNPKEEWPTTEGESGSQEITQNQSTTPITNITSTNITGAIQVPDSMGNITTQSEVSEIYVKTGEAFSLYIGQPAKITDLTDQEGIPYKVILDTIAYEGHMVNASSESTNEAKMAALIKVVYGEGTEHESVGYLHLEPDQTKVFLNASISLLGLKDNEAVMVVKKFEQFIPTREPVKTTKGPGQSAPGEAEKSIPGEAEKTSNVFNPIDIIVSFVKTIFH